MRQRRFFTVPVGTVGFGIFILDASRAHPYGVVMHYEISLVQPSPGSFSLLNFCSKVCASGVPFFRGYAEKAKMPD
jgi:hypothetical protein